MKRINGIGPYPGVPAGPGYGSKMVVRRDLAMLQTDLNEPELPIAG